MKLCADNFHILNKSQKPYQIEIESPADTINETSTLLSAILGYSKKGNCTSECIMSLNREDNKLAVNLANCL